MKLSEIKKLDEMNAIAAYGNWEIGETVIAYRAFTVVKTHYDQIGEVKIPEVGVKKVMKIKTSDFYIVGDFVSKGDESKFEEIFQITLVPTIIPGHSEKYMNVDGVKVPNVLRGLSIALEMYRFFVKDLKLNILGDEIQYFGARKLWARLSKNVDVIVDIIDIRDGKVLEANVKLHHGSDDWDFDERVWSYDVDKKDRRLILKEI
jgi:hypothetical protein